MSELFDIPAVKRLRVSHKADMDSLKVKHRIQTHCQHRWTAPNESKRDWMAVSMNAACSILKGYDLTEEQKTSLPELMAGYCRLLDESRLLADGCKTEFEAVKLAAEAAEGYFRAIERMKS